MARPRPARILRDADPAHLTGARVGVFGFGNQGRAQAECLRDSGVAVRVLPRAGGPSEAAVTEAGFPVLRATDLGECDILAVLVPDEVQAELLNGPIRSHAAPGTLLLFAHGFTLREHPRLLREDLDAALVCPLGPGSLLRERFLEGGGLAGLFAVVQDFTGTAEARALAYAAAIGLTRAGLIETTLEEEVVSDLFAEQAVLVGGAVELMRAAWETLVEAGVSGEVAYYSCVEELRQILELVSRDGPAGMRSAISTTARYGGLTRGPRIVGEDARAEMRAALEEIRTGSFAAEWKQEQEFGGGRLEDLTRREREHPMEAAGRRVRAELGPAGDADRDDPAEVDTGHPEI
ncbi:MAG: ketol-acid reductoisomerase [Gemmatimonadota bacterium]|nr:ketol-acid reductoisomerase [Gemmatimonadota bacterium]